MKKDNSESVCVDVETRPGGGLLKACNKALLQDKMSDIYGKIPSFAVAVNKYLVKNAVRERYIFDTDEREKKTTLLKRKVENILPKVKITTGGDFLLDAPTIYSSSEVVGKFIRKEGDGDEEFVDMELQPEVAKTLKHIYFKINNTDTKSAHIRREYIRDDRDKGVLVTDTCDTSAKDDFKEQPIDTTSKLY